MSFMYNPYPYDDPRAINKPVLAPQTIESVTAGTPQAAVRLAREFAETLKATPQRNLIVAFDGYTTADWTRTINLLSQQLDRKSTRLNSSHDRQYRMPSSA